MTALDKPPTAIHLGKGDNWNIPRGRDDLKELWRKAIIQWYQLGIGAFGSVPELQQWGPRIKDVAEKGREVEGYGNIPGTFLEALTFEKSFTERMQRILPKAK